MLLWLWPWKNNHLWNKNKRPRDTSPSRKNTRCAAVASASAPPSKLETSHAAAFSQLNAESISLELSQLPSSSSFSSMLDTDSLTNILTGGTCSLPFSSSSHLLLELPSSLFSSQTTTRTQEPDSLLLANLPLFQ